VYGVIPGWFTSALMARILKSALAVLVVGSLFPAAAAAAGTTTTTTTTSTSTSTTSHPPKPKPKPVKGSGRIYLPDAFFVHRQAVTVPKRWIHVKGVVFPYVPGQRVTLRVSLNHKQFKKVRIRLKPSRHHHFSYFSYRLKTPGLGGVLVKMTHYRNKRMQGFIVRRGWTALDENIGFGSTGRFVQLVQQRLAALHFYIPQTGVYDSGTGLAIDAYHRLLRRGVSQSLDGKTISFLLNGWGEFKVRFHHQGRHAEGNLTDQLLALIDGNKVDLIFPISSGKPSTPTILGSFRVYSRVSGYLPDGMYYSSFFIRGYAIHGYDPAPDYPASHGCMRLPIQDAITAYNWLNYGDWVDTYYE
jgi:L,D-transpeptidase catalytic domain